MKTIWRSASGFVPVIWRRKVKQALERRAVESRAQAAWRQLIRAAGEISESSLDAIGTQEDWARRRPAVRQTLLSALGLDPLPERTPLQARITGTVLQGPYRIEKLVFESRPGLCVTANFYLPRGQTAPLPCMMYLCGHWPALDGAKTGFQERYLWYPANGFALLVVDPLGFGEISGIHPGTNRLNRWDWLSLGYTPAGVEVWNAMRALDWLATRPEVDPARIGVTGISGGGVMTQFLAALDERVAVAAPSCSTYTIGSQAELDLVPQQCDCSFYPNLDRMDFPEILALIAPRPLMILGGRQDPIFPPAGFREAFRRTARIYGLYGADGGLDSRIRLVESSQGHADPPHFLRETRRWMCRWLKKTDLSEAQLDEVPGPPTSPEALRCTQAVLPGALNSCIHERWIRVPARDAPASPEEGRRRKESLLQTLRTRTFGWFPRTEIPFRTRAFPASGGYAGEFSDFREHEFDTEPGVPVKVSLLTPKGKSGPVPLIVWTRNADESVIFPDIDEFFPVLRTHAIAILTPRFAERPLSGHEHADLERTAALSGRSLTALRVWDILRTVDWVEGDRGLGAASVTVYGRGDAGIAGLYAALLRDSIGHVILRDPPSSHYEGAALPSILRETDIDEAAGALAPRRLTLLSRRRDGFALARTLFKQAGALESFGYAASLTEALAPVVRAQAGGTSPC